MFLFLLPVLITSTSIFLLILYMATQVVPESEEWTLERFGSFRRILKPGLHIIVPFVERVGSRVSLREHVLDIPPQDVITKDNALVHVDGLVFFRVFDTAKAAYQVANLNSAISNLTITNIRTVVGDIVLDQVLYDRDNINHSLMRVIDEATDPWGIKIIRIELKDVRPAKELEASMARQMKAEREKRANILEAQGQREADIERAEGKKQAAIARAQGEKEAAILRAEGEKQKRFLEAEARERFAEAEAKATQLLSDVVKKGDVQAINYFIAKEYMKTLKSIGSAENQKIIFMPLEASSTIGALGGIAELAKSALDKQQKK